MAISTSKSGKKKSSHNRIPVIQLTIRGKRVKKHQSMSDAENSTGVNSGSISKATRGITNTAGGFRWELA